MVAVELFRHKRIVRRRLTRLGTTTYARQHIQGFYVTRLNQVSQLRGSHGRFSVGCSAAIPRSSSFAFGPKSATLLLLHAALFSSRDACR